MQRKTFEGVLNGLFLVAPGLSGAGCIWVSTRCAQPLRSPSTAPTRAGSRVCACGWGAGGKMMPIAAGGHAGTAVQEGLIAFALISLSVSMVVVCATVLWGLRTPTPAGVVVPAG